MSKRTPGVAFLLLLLGAPAAAQNLYSLDGVVYEEAFTGISEPLVGVGANGYLYVQNQGDGIYFPWACYHPDDPVGTRHAPEFPVGKYLTAMTWNFDGMAFLYWGDEGRQLGVFRCGTGPDFPDGYTIETSDHDFIDLKALARKSNYNTPDSMMMAPDGAFCFKTADGLRCGNPATDGELTLLPLRVSLEEINDNLAVDPGLAESVVLPNVSEYPEKQWELRDVLWTPDGRLFSLVALRFFAQDANQGKLGTDWMPYVLEHFEDGTFDIWVKPPRPPAPGPKWMSGDKHVTFYHPLIDAERLYFNDQLKAVLVWPVYYMEYYHKRFQKGDYLYYGTPDGTGFYVLPYEGDLTSYLSVFHGRLNGILQRFNGTSHLRVLPGHDIAFEKQEPGSLSLLRLTLDLDKLDLDTDGFSYNEELAMGSSDYTISSDGSTTADPIEEWVTGTDLNEFSDDPAPWRPGRFSYVESGLIRKMFAEYGLSELVSRGSANGSPADGPLCAGSNEDGLVCVLADRVTRAVVPMSENATRRFDPTGSYVLYRTEQGIDRFFFADSRVETVALDDEIVAAVGKDLNLADWTVDFYAAKDDLYVSLYQYVTDNQEVWDEFYVLFFHAGEGTLLYDHQKARCDSGLGHCDPTYELDPSDYEQHAHDLIAMGAGVMGYSPELDRLIIEVAGLYGRYFVGLHPDEEPRVLVGPNYLQGNSELRALPVGLQPTGHGDYFGGWGFLDGWLNAKNNSRIQGMGNGSLASFFWGGIGLAHYYDDGIWELVRYEGWGDPGDIVVNGYPGNGMGTMLYRSGPRGGLAEALLEPYYEMQQPWGIDIRDDGMLCLVDRSQQGGSVYVFQQGEPGAVATNLVMVAGDLGDVRDCAWGDDGDLYWVTSKPARIWHLPELWVEDFELFAELPEGSRPFDLTHAPDGSLEVLDADGAERGFAYLSDGRRLSMPGNSWWVQVDGENVVQLDQLMFGKLGVKPSDNSSCYVRFQERPDGLVVAIPFGSENPPPLGGRAWVFDPDNGGKWPLSSYPIYPYMGNGLAIIPGGNYSDPWGVADGPQAAQDGPAADDPPTAQSTGYPVMREKGCSAGQGGSRLGAALLLFALFLLVGIRRSRTPILLPVVLAAVVLAGCGSGSGETGDGIDNPLSETNVEPLEPMTVGSRTVVSTNGDLLHRVVAERITVNGNEGRRTEWSEGTVNTWERTAEGWALAASDAGEIDPPLLMVPHKVWLGKEWTSGPYQFQVTGRSLELTPWGRRMTWQIARVGPEGFKIRYYAEGRGWYKDTGYESKEVVASFFPLNGDESDPPDIDKGKLNPLPGVDGNQFVLPYEGAAKFLVHDSLETGVLGAWGVSWAFLFGAWSLISESDCVRIEDGVAKVISSKAGAASMLVDDHARCYVGPDPEVGAPDFTHFAIPAWVSGEGKYHYAEETQGKAQLLGLLGSEETTSPELLVVQGETARQAPWNNTAFDLMPEFRAYLDSGLVWTHFDDRWGNRFSPMYGSDGQYRVGRFTHSGVLVEASYESGVVLGRTRGRAYVGFAPTVTTTTKDHRALFATNHSVTELRYANGEAMIEKVARFDIEKDHFVTGAVRVGNQVVVTTGNRVAKADPFNGHDGREMYFWTIDAPFGSGVPYTPPASLAVGAQVTGADVLVCWPETDDALTTEGWTLGGAAPARVVPLYDDSCALLIRDFVAAQDIWVEGGGVVTGPVPGVGEMEIVVPRGTVPLGYDAVTNYGAAPALLWPTADGGMVGLGKIFDSAGIPQFRGPESLADKAGVTGKAGIQDGGGTGFWQEEEGYLYLYASDGKVVKSQQGWVDGNGKGKQIALIGQVWGGGIVLRTPVDGNWGNFEIAIDGSVTPLPDTPQKLYAEGFTSMVVGASGDICASAGVKGLYCWGDDDWSEVDLGEESHGGGRLVPLSSSDILMVGGGMEVALSWLIDPGTLEVVPYALEASLEGQFKYDNEGELFFLRKDFDAGWGGKYVTVADGWPQQILSAGPEPIEVPDTGWHGGYQSPVAGVVPTSGYLFVYLENNNFMRVPR